MADSTVVRLTPVDDDARKLVFEPHDIDGCVTLVEYRREDSGWRFAGAALVTGLLIRDGDSVMIANGEEL